MCEELTTEVREVPRAFRPKEKLLSRGPRALTRVELLSVLLDGDTGATRSARIARRHSLERMAELSVAEWRAERGVGRVAATRLAAAFELGRRAYRRGADRERPRLCGPREAYAEVRHLARARKEHLVGLYLDAQNGLLHKETISIGSLNTTRSHPREILLPAVTHLALGFILAHNHPSGCVEPSTEDLEFTRAIRRAAELMGIELYDHLIVAGEGYTSLRERGLLG